MIYLNLFLTFLKSRLIISQQICFVKKKGKFYHNFSRTPKIVSKVTFNNKIYKKYKQ